MSQWDDYDPEQTRRRMLDDPAQAGRAIAADKRLIAAMNRNPIDLNGLRAALKDNASPDRIVVNGLPALHVAVHKHDMRALNALLDHGARTDDWDAEGATALDEAYRKRFPEAIKRLKQSGAETRVYGEAGHGKPEDVQASSYELRANSRLLNMIRRGTPAQVKQALELGADVNMKASDAGLFWPPLHTAIAQCEPEKVKLLIDAGADIFARSSRGEEVTDVQWNTPGAKLLGPEWNEIFDILHQRGYTNFFVKHPSQFTLDDLRQPLPTGEKDAPTLLHHLVHTGHADFIFDVLNKNPDDRLTSADFLKRSEKHRKTLLEACAENGLLPKIFTPDIWQGRLEEMMALKAPAEKIYTARGKVDFSKAAADVRARRLADLKAKAPKLRLKGM